MDCEECEKWRVKIEEKVSASRMNEIIAEGDTTTPHSTLQTPNFFHNVRFIGLLTLYT